MVDIKKRSKNKAISMLVEAGCNLFYLEDGTVIAYEDLSPCNEMQHYTIVKGRDITDFIEIKSLAFSSEEKLTEALTDIEKLSIREFWFSNQYKWKTYQWER